MKKTLISIIIIGLVLLVAGKIIMISTENDNKITINNEITAGTDNISTSSDFKIINNEFDDVNNIDISLGVYSVLIESDKSVKSVEIKAKKPIFNVGGADVDRLEMENKNGTLTIKQKQDKNNLNLSKFKNYKGEIIIKIPSDKKIDKISLENGVGSIELKGLSLNDLSIDAGVSSIDASDINVSECHVFSGTGNIKLYNILVDEAEVETGTGWIYLNGDIVKKAELSTGVSSIELELNGKESDYGFDVETGVGSIKINDSKYKKEVNINNSSKRTIKIETGTGSIDIKTK